MIFDVKTSPQKWFFTSHFLLKPSYFQLIEMCPDFELEFLPSIDSICVNFCQVSSYFSLFPMHILIPFIHLFSSTWTASCASDRIVWRVCSIQSFCLLKIATSVHTLKLFFFLVPSLQPFFSTIFPIENATPHGYCVLLDSLSFI